MHNSIAGLFTCTVAAVSALMLYLTADTNVDPSVQKSTYEQVSEENHIDNRQTLIPENLNPPLVIYGKQ